jgi:hypothetical protein
MMSTGCDLRKTGLVETALPQVMMLAALEHQDKFDGFLIEMIPLMNDVECNTREIVRFLHKRNSCNCLQEVYHQVKKITRVSYCHGCHTKKDAKEVRSCVCGVFQYCSRQCQLFAWPRHKEYCKGMREMRGKSIAKYSSDIHEVD